MEEARKLFSLRADNRLLIRPDNQTCSVGGLQFSTAWQNSDSESIFACLTTRYFPFKMVVTIAVRIHGSHLFGISFRKIILRFSGPQ